MGNGDPDPYADVCIRIHARVLSNTQKQVLRIRKNGTSSFFMIPQHARLPGGAPGSGT